MKNKISADYKRAFKQADIRGIYPKEIDEEVAYFVARAFVDEYQHKTVLVARDMRLSSPALHKAFCTGVTDAGANVVDLGLVSTPMLYFASGAMELPGVMITASHNPKKYNGLKLILSEAVPLTESFGLGKIRKRIEKGDFTEPAKVGKIKLKDIKKAYQKFIFKGIKVKNFADINIVADVGNGMAAVELPLLEEKMPVKFETIFSELDGNFPNRDSDPTLKRNQKVLSQTLKQGKFDFGISFDGDSDRIAFLDENGEYVNCAIIGALISEYLLRSNIKAKIVYTGLTGRIYQESIKKAGGVPVLARVGHSFIKETMRKKDVLFGCEHSGHFYFKDNFYTDSVALTLFYVLSIYTEAKAQGLTFSDLVKPYLIYKQMEDVVIEVDDKNKAIKTVEKYLLDKKPQNLKKFDGLLVDFGDVWGMVKISVTEHALKIMFESEVKSKAASIQKELVSFVKSIAKD